MTAVARFRLFGRGSAAPSLPRIPPYGAPEYGPSPGWAGPAPIGGGAPQRGPATRAARPAGRPFVDPLSDPPTDPPTDPHGFPPVPPAGAAPDHAEAAALAGAFAVDYLSWDEDDPARRGRVLHDYLAVPGPHPARLGWSGRGRQRAEFALPGRVRSDGDARVLVDVRVRVTPYRAVGERDASATVAEPDPGVAGVPATAPAPTGRGWRSLASCWVRLSVPVVIEGGRLVVDAWEEALGEPPAPVVAPVPEDHSLADDDPLAELRPGGAW